MKVCRFWLFLVAVLLAAETPDYLSARRKLDRIESDQLRAGARVEFSLAELNAYIAHEAPEGARNLRLEVVARGKASGRALVDFGKLERGQGHQPGWLMSKLLDGERPISVTARIRSANGETTVDVERVEISGLLIDGRTLDFLIRDILLPLYPDAVVGRPFQLSHHIERLEVEPSGVGVVIGR